MKTIITTCICLLLSISLLKPVVAQDNARGLDGKTFQIRMENPSNPADAKTDIIIFKDRSFDSQGSRENGFGQAGYIFKSGGTSGDFFQATSTSEKEGTMIWKGTIKGNTIEGAAIWEKPGQAAVKYPFKGEVVSADKVNTKTPAEKQSTDKK